MEKRAGAFWSEGQRLKGTWSDEEDDAPLSSRESWARWLWTCDLEAASARRPHGWATQVECWVGPRGLIICEKVQEPGSVDEWTGTTGKGGGSLASADSPGSPLPLSTCETWGQWVHYSLCRAPVLSQRVRAGVEKLTVKGHRCPSQMRNSAAVVRRQLWPVLVNMRGCAPVKLYLHRQGWAILCWPWFRIKDLWSLY